MRGCTGRPWTLAAVVALAVGAAQAPAAIPAAAAARPVTQGAAVPCQSAPGSSGSIRGLPYAQQRFVPHRLKPLADGAGIVVAVIDSGVDARHPQLRGRVGVGKDFLRGGPDGRQDCNGHGTGVASIIAAAPVADATAQFQGLAPGVTIVPVRLTERQDLDGRTQRDGDRVGAATFADAIRWAANEGNADVVNLSVVLYDDEPVVRDAVAEAVGKGVVIVAAVGNHATTQGNPRPYPASYPGVLGVGAIGMDGRRQDYSQTGDYVDVMAPGEAVTVASPGGGHQQGSGTSYAAPFVSATAALVLDRFPDLPPARVAERIIATADPSPAGSRSEAYGYGVLNPYRALTETIVDPGVVARPAALPQRSPDPAAVARQLRQRRSWELAYRVAGAAGALSVVVALVGVVLPRGRRRRWRPAER